MVSQHNEKLKEYMNNIMQSSANTTMSEYKERNYSTSHPSLRGKSHLTTCPKEEVVKKECTYEDLSECQSPSYDKTPNSLLFIIRYLKCRFDACIFHDY